MTQILVVLLIDRSHVSASFTYPSLAQVGFFTYQSLAHVGIRHSQYKSLLFLYTKCFDCPHTVCGQPQNWSLCLYTPYPPCMTSSCTGLQTRWRLRASLHVTG